MRTLRNISPVSLESLEARKLLAGNVTLAIDGGTVVITGDNKSNEIHVTANATHYFVTGVNGTTVNGGASDTVGPTLALPMTVSMGNGEDVVRYTLIQTFDNTISTGNGQDTVIIEDCSIHGTLSISTGNASDEVRLFGNVLVFGNTTIDGGHGHDSLTGVAALFTGGTEVIDVETVA